MSTPMISVIMPVYNGEKYLREAIDSILNQSYSNFELIILNDASIDKTEKIILSYSDSRIIYVKNERNLQLVETLNKGIELARGRYIARMDQDDISVSERFEKQIEFMIEHPDIDVCGSYVETIGAKQQKWIYPRTSEYIEAAMLFHSPLVHPSVMIKKTFFDNQKYDDKYCKAEDYYLWVKNIKKHKFANIPEFLLFYRLHEQQMGKVYGEDQLGLSDTIRLNLLHEFGIYPSSVEFEIHKKISRYKFVDIYAAEEWLFKLYQQNQVCGYFDKNIFKEYIDERWWIVLNQSASIGMKAFFYYYKSKKIKRYNKSFMKNIKFMIKCIIGYNAFSEDVIK